MSGHIDKHVDITMKELQQAKVPLAWRDYCADLLVPLNKCRRENFYLPWACEHERHEFEKCEYYDYKARVQAIKKEREEKTQ